MWEVLLLRCSVKEGFAVLELFEAVVVGVLADMLAQLLPLLDQVLGHLVVDLLEELVNLGQELISCVLESRAHLLQSILS